MTDKFITLANPLPVPKDVAVCPECEGTLIWQVTTEDGLEDLILDCENEDEDIPDTEHRNWQSDWQPIYDRVKKWIQTGNSPNAQAQARRGTGITRRQRMSDKAIMSARQRVLSGNRLNWRVGQLVAFVHGPGRRNIYRFRIEELRDGLPFKSRLVTRSK
jgi:hypothetical protein